MILSTPSLDEGLEDFEAPPTAPPENSDETLTQLRLRVRDAGFSPIPVYGKNPAQKEWTDRHNESDDEIRMMEISFPHAKSTGLLTKFNPAIDLDIRDDEGAAEALEDLAREHLEDKGQVLVRIGQAPKRLIPLQTNAPFPKLRRAFIAPSGPAPDGKDPAIEILGDGQHFVAFGVHPNTGQPYRWHGGEPGEVKRNELPAVSQQEARDFLEEATRLLLDRGYKLKKTLKKEGKSGCLIFGMHSASP